jgi:hypothetical protein
MVRIDSPCRGASFLCRTHVSTIYDCGIMKGLWGRCLGEGERKLKEGEGKRVGIDLVHESQRGGSPRACVEGALYAPRWPLSETLDVHEKKKSFLLMESTNHHPRCQTRPRKWKRHGSGTHIVDEIGRFCKRDHGMVSWLIHLLCLCQLKKWTKHVLQIRRARTCLFFSSKMSRTICENICVTTVHPCVVKKVVYVSSILFVEWLYLYCLLSGFIYIKLGQWPSVQTIYFTYYEVNLLARLLASWGRDLMWSTSNVEDQVSLSPPWWALLVFYLSPHISTTMAQGKSYLMICMESMSILLICWCNFKGKKPFAFPFPLQWLIGAVEALKQELIHPVISTRGVACSKLNLDCSICCKAPSLQGGYLEMRARKSRYGWNIPRIWCLDTCARPARCLLPSFSVHARRFAGQNVGGRIPAGPTCTAVESEGGAQYSFLWQHTLINHLLDSSSLSWIQSCHGRINTQLALLFIVREGIMCTHGHQ